jgi:hypothetical protein
MPFEWDEADHPQLRPEQAWLRTTGRSPSEPIRLAINRRIHSGQEVSSMWRTVEAFEY